VTSFHHPELRLAVDGRLLYQPVGATLPLVIAVAVEAARPTRALSDALRAVAERWEATAHGWSAIAGHWHVRLSSTSAADGIALRVLLEPRADSGAWSLRRLELSASLGDVAAAGEPTIALRIAYCGAHSRSGASRSYIASLDPGMTLSSWWVGAIRTPGGLSVVLGAEESLHFATEVVLGADVVTARQHLEGWHAVPGEVVESDGFWLARTDGAAQVLLEQFACRLAAAHHARPGASPSGWGSWGHWLERIDLSLMRETIMTLDGIAGLKRSVQVIQIDDGWSEMLESGRVAATWRPNRRFPSGIAPLAAEIRRTGRDCGLWLLPFTVNAGSTLLSQHPEWMVATEEGEPFQVGGGASYCLDPTHPGAAAWLRDLFRNFVDWDVRYLKLDFLRALLSPDPDGSTDGFDVRRRYHGARTRVEAYRAGLMLIREVLGDATTIVACSAPAAPGAGLVSTHRVGPDIEPRWVGAVSGVRDAARAIIANWFWHGRTWVNDPDYLLICDSEPVTRFWVTVVAMSGGSVVISADLADLAEWEERYLAFATPAVGRAATPIDLFSSACDPRLLHLPFDRPGERWAMIAVLNWTDSPIIEHFDIQLALRAESVHVWDAWRLHHRVQSGTAAGTAFVEAQSAGLFRLTEVADHPQVIGTDVHWAQGWLELEAPEWNATEFTLTVRGASDGPREGLAWVWVPPQLKAVAADLEPSGLVRLIVTPGITHVLRFEPDLAGRPS